TAVLLRPRQTGVAGLVQLSAPLAVASPAGVARQVLLQPGAKLGAERGLARRVAEIHSAIIARRLTSVCARRLDEQDVPAACPGAARRPPGRASARRGPGARRPV